MSWWRNPEVFLIDCHRHRYRRTLRFALGRTLQGLLFGVQPADAATAAIAIGALSAVAFASAWIPARRAARVDPLVALRSE